MSKQSGGEATFGSWLSAQMAACGFASNVALAAQIGVDNSTISRWRNGLMVPNMDQLRALEGPLKTPVTQMAVRAGHLTEDQARVRRVPAALPPQPVGLGLDAEADGLPPEDVEAIRAQVRALKRARGLDT